MKGKKFNYHGGYQQLQRVGSGKFGVCYTIRSNKTGQILLAKHISLYHLEKEKVIKEFDIIKQLNHPYIVKYVDSFIEEDEMILIMEYCGEKDLEYHINRMKNDKTYFNEHLVINWVFQLILAVQFMHSRKIMHRDIKPGNIFVDSEMNLKLGDFGVSKMLDSTEENSKTHTGTPYYMAPEILNTGVYSFKADIWSLGCVIYEICTLERVITPKNKDEKIIPLRMWQMIKEANVQDIPSIYSKDLNQLVRKMLTKDTEKRPKTEDLLKDKVMIQLMINRSSTEINLKKQYPKTIQKPTLTDSFIDRQTDIVQIQMKKLEEEVKLKMNSMKKKKIQKNQIDHHYEDIKKKMEEISIAVKIAFQKLKSEGKLSEVSNESTNESSIKANKNNSVQVSEDSMTIQSINLSQKQSKALKNDSSKKVEASNNNSYMEQSDMTLVESQMINSKQPFEKSNKNKSNNSSNNSGVTIKSKNFSIHTKNNRSSVIPIKNATVEDLLEKTINSEYNQTIKEDEPFNFAEKTMNKLELLQNTLIKNPSALLDESFLNYTLSVSADDLKFKANLTKKTIKEEKQLQKQQDEIINFDFTKKSGLSQSLNRTIKKPPVGTKQLQQKGQQRTNEKQQYPNDFHIYEQQQMDEETTNRRKNELSTIISIYQQTLNDMNMSNNNMNGTSESGKFRNKYLVMSEIKEQSNQGGSMMSRNNDSI